MTDSGREKFEHSYDDLAVAALKFMSAQSGEHLVKAFAQSRADDIERKGTVALTSSLRYRVRPLRSDRAWSYQISRSYLTNRIRNFRGLRALGVLLS